MKYHARIPHEILRSAPGNDRSVKPTGMRRHGADRVLAADSVTIPPLPIFSFRKMVMAEWGPHRVIKNEKLKIRDKEISHLGHYTFCFSLSTEKSALFLKFSYKIQNPIFGRQHSRVKLIFAPCLELIHVASLGWQT